MEKECSAVKEAKITKEVLHEEINARKLKISSNTSCGDHQELYGSFVSPIQLDGPLGPVEKGPNFNLKSTQAHGLRGFSEEAPKQAQAQKKYRGEGTTSWKRCAHANQGTQAEIRVAEHGGKRTR
jgi:hypothetical protein